MKACVSQSSAKTGSVAGPKAGPAAQRSVRCGKSQRVARDGIEIKKSELLRILPVVGAGCLGLIDPPPAAASLVQFPAMEMNNTYYLVRAGETENEASNFVDTNPVNKTSMSNGLSDLGKKQVLQQTYRTLSDLNACGEGCWLWPSTTQNAYQTAEILAYLFGIGRDRIVPEYSFLDMRGLGAFDGLPPEEAATKIHAVDAVDYLQRPPRTYTGTPNESAQDVMIRVRQMLSVTETQYYGANVVFVSPDSENLSVLQTALLGMDLRRHAEMAFAPGEARALILSDVGPDTSSGSVPCKRPPNCL